jgi:hypothetical protein
MSTRKTALSRAFINTAVFVSQTGPNPGTWKTGDVVCLLEGASKPTIIRTCKDNFIVIKIAVTLQQDVQTESGCRYHPGVLQLQYKVTSSLIDLLFSLIVHREVEFKGSPELA